jgi:hypothetical protein
MPSSNTSSEKYEREIETLKSDYEKQLRNVREDLKSIKELLKESQAMKDDLLVKNGMYGYLSCTCYCSLILI